MAEYNPPSQGWDLGEFNPYYFSYGLQSLTLDEADARYLRKTGGYISGSLTIGGTLDTSALTINGSPIDLSLITGITPGTVSASKTIIVDSSKNVSGFGNVGMGTLTCTGAAINGTISNTAGFLDCSSSFRITSGSSPTYGNGIGMRFVGLSATGYISSHNHFLSTHNNIDIQDGLIFISATTASPADAIGFNTNTPKAKWDFNQASSTANKLRLSYTVNSVYTELYCDASSNLVLGNHYGTLLTAAQPNITSVGTLTGLTIASNSRPLILQKSDLTSGNGVSFTLGKSAAIDQQGEYTFTYSSSTGQSTLSLGHFGTPQMLQVYSSGLVNISGTTDSSSSTTGILTVGGGAGIAKNLYVGTGIYGTIQTAAQPNITSLGTLSSMSSTGFIMSNSFVYVASTSLSNTSDSSRLSEYCYQMRLNSDTAGVQNGIGFGIHTASASNTTPMGAIRVKRASTGTWTGAMYLGVKQANTQTGNITDVLTISNDASIRQDAQSALYAFTQTSTASPAFIYQTTTQNNATALLCQTSGNSVAISTASDGAHIGASGTSASLFLECNAVAYWKIDSTAGHFMPSYQPQNRRIGVQTLLNDQPLSPIDVGYSTISDKVISVYWPHTGNVAGTESYYGIGANNSQLELQGVAVGLYSNSKGNALGDSCLVAHTANSKGVCSIGTLGGSTAADFNILRTTAGIRLGKAESLHNSFTIQYNHVSDGSQQNYISFDEYGSSKQFVVSANYGCGIGDTPSNFKALMHLSGSVSYTVNYKKYDVSTNGYTTVSGSAIDLSLYCSSNIFCGTAIACASDERYKTNIMDYTIDEGTYMKLKPKRYLKHDNWEIGLVAQEAVRDVDTYPDFISPVPDKEMVKRDENDPDDGFAWSLSYERLTIVNMAMIQKLISRIEMLEAELDNHRHSI